VGTIEVAQSSVNQPLERSKCCSPQPGKGDLDRIDRKLGSLARYAVHRPVGPVVEFNRTDTVTHLSERSGCELYNMQGRLGVTI
jgi:hypothetical protein